MRARQPRLVLDTMPWYAGDGEDVEPTQHGPGSAGVTAWLHAALL